MTEEANHHQRISSMLNQLTDRLNEETDMHVAGMEPGAPELLVTGPGNTLHAVDFAVDETGAHFGTFARFRRSIESQSKKYGGKTVQGLVITDGSLSGNLQSMARELDITAIDASELNAAATAEAIIKEIRGGSAQADDQ